MNIHKAAALATKVDDSYLKSVYEIISKRQARELSPVTLNRCYVFLSRLVAKLPS